MNKIVSYFHQMRSLQRINMALSRGAATSAMRRIQLTDPTTWEFSGFSQNGEDGILDVLSRRIRSPNRYFIEIGASDGLENNTSWLALAHRWSGLWVEGDLKTSQWCERMFTALNYGVETLCLFVTQENVQRLTASTLHMDPDVFSLDVDGNDYYLAKMLFEQGFRPKIFAVEYNSSFGPDKSVSIPYQPDFRRENDLYYGCSVAAWRRLFRRHGYQFVTVDNNGVNAFFIDSSQFDGDFVAGLRGCDFRENFAQMRQHKRPWQEQFALIQGRELTEIK